MSGQGGELLLLLFWLNRIFVNQVLSLNAYLKVLTFSLMFLSAHLLEAHTVSP